jgi:predicted nucleotidyltransferase
VDLEPDRSLLGLGSLLMELRDLLMCPVAVVTEKGLWDRIRQYALDEAVPL